MAFTDNQNETIRRDLIREARRCGVSIGMRKTSVEQLADAVGISKGSFYKFFPSKELLFFAVLEDIHTECFAAAQASLQEAAELPPANRAAEAILAACGWLSETQSFCSADFRMRSRQRTIMMTRHIFVRFWRVAACSPRTGSHWLPLSYAD